MVKYFVGGVLLGTIITVTAGLTIGPQITLAGVGSGNDGGSKGRYDFRIDEAGGITRYTMVDQERGVATVVTSDGKTVTVQAPEGGVAEAVK